MEHSKNVLVLSSVTDRGDCEIIEAVCEQLAGVIEENDEAVAGETSIYENKVECTVPTVPNLDLYKRGSDEHRYETVPE